MTTAIHTTRGKDYRPEEEREDQKSMEHYHHADERKERDWVIGNNPDEDSEMKLIIEFLENDSFSFEEAFRDSLTIQQGIYNSFNQEKGALLHHEIEHGKAPVQNNPSTTEAGQSSKVHPYPTQDCPICMDSKYPHETFVVEGCFHVFCLDCIRGHIGAKIEENASTIRCPEVNCKIVLEIEFCSLILPPKLLERWGSLLCESVIKTKFYCPFENCSAPLLVDDADNGVAMAVAESKCPHCFRLFCASCRVPWHSDISCEDFQKLRADEREREDLMLMKLAKEKKWQRCPKCGYVVERTDGCSFMKCRCDYCFCYKCGGEMTQESHRCSKCNS